MSFPKVSIDIVSSTTTSMEHNKEEFWTEISKRMLTENPLIYQLLAVTERIDTKSEQFLEGYKRGACLIYALLSCQAEADEMNEMWGVGSVEKEEIKPKVKCPCGSTNIIYKKHVDQGQAVQTKECKDCGLNFF